MVNWVGSLSAWWALLLCCCVQALADLLEKYPDRYPAELVYILYQQQLKPSAVSRFLSKVSPAVGDRSRPSHRVCSRALLVASRSFLPLTSSEAAGRRTVDVRDKTGRSLTCAVLALLWWAGRPALCKHLSQQLVAPSASACSPETVSWNPTPTRPGYKRVLWPLTAIA